MPGLRWLTRGALIRLVVFVAVLAGTAVYSWRSMLRMPLQSYAGPWVPLDAEEIALREALRRDVQVLAGEIGERNVFRPQAYQAAREFIGRAFEQAGYRVEQQAFPVGGATCYNLEATRPGGSPAAGIVVVGAHYDSVSGCPGANDNASAVAALLALARLSASMPGAGALRFVAFANEEPPFFQTANMGSLVYARRCRAAGERIVAMISLETIGCFRDAPGSQEYPFPVGFFYPDTGNFIAFVGNPGSSALVRRVVASFRRQVKFPSEGAALPAVLPGIGWSDHWAFWQNGYPAVMVTDTAPFRYPHYHTAQDTPDKLDYDRLARVVAGLRLVLRELAADPSGSG
jgi:hypothetical protein